MAGLSSLSICHTSAQGQKATGRLGIPFDSSCLNVNPFKNATAMSRETKGQRFCVEVWQTTRCETLFAVGEAFCSSFSRGSANPFKQPGFGYKLTVFELPTINPSTGYCAPACLFFPNSFFLGMPSMIVDPGFQLLYSRFADFRISILEFLRGDGSGCAINWINGTALKF